MNLDESDREMDSNEQALFLQVSRSKSNDSIIRKFLPQPNDMPDRSLVWDLQPLPMVPKVIISTKQQMNNINIEKTSINMNNEVKEESINLHVFRKVKKQKVRTKCDYDKNICGYITKKIIRQFIGNNYLEEIDLLTRKYQCSLSQCKSYYLKRVDRVTGPSHLPQLFNPQQDDSYGIIQSKKAFKQFYRWFLKQRYIRYLLIQGKMDDKKAYIQYKNNQLFKYLGKQQQEIQVPHFVPRVLTRSRGSLQKILSPQI